MALGLTAPSILWSQASPHGRDLPHQFRSLAGVTLNRDNAATIRAKLGPTSERRVGADHDAFASWCYTLGEDSSPTLLEVMSDISDMGTPGRAVNVIHVRAHASRQDREQCARLPRSTTLSTPGGLRLGLTRSSVQRLLGRPTRTTTDSLIYKLDGKEYMRRGSPEYRTWNTPEHRRSCFEGGEPYANVGGTAVVILLKGRAAEIRLERYDQSTC